MAEHVKKDAEIQEIKQDYLNEILKVQEAANGQGMMHIYNSFAFPVITRILLTLEGTTVLF